MERKNKANVLRVFAGYDARERNGFHVFIQSLIDTASVPLSIQPLSGEQRDGTNTFIYERFLVPHYCNYRGWAIFLDGSDMLVRRDITELYAMRDETYAVQVVKHDYQTRNKRKYLGTSMEADNADYPRKNWSSVVLWNCEHPANAALTPSLVKSATGSYLHRFDWLDDVLIGSLNPAWNVLIREQEHHNPRIAHYTVGIPHIQEYSADSFADEYRAVLAGINAPIEAAGAKEN